jgi:hypothetical protein
MGSALNNYLTPVLSEKFSSAEEGNYSNVGMPMFVSLFLMILGLLFAVSIAPLISPLLHRSQDRAT